MRLGSPALASGRTLNAGPCRDPKDRFFVSVNSSIPVEGGVCLTDIKCPGLLRAGVLRVSFQNDGPSVRVEKSDEQWTVCLVSDIGRFSRRQESSIFSIRGRRREDWSKLTRSRDENPVRVLA